MANDQRASSSRAALLLVAVAIAVTAIGALPLAAGLVAAPALAVICRPVYERLAKRLNRSGAALVVIVLVWILLAAPGAFLATLVVRQAPAAITEVQHAVDRLRISPPSLLGANPDTLVAHLGASSMGWLSAAVGPALGGVGHAIVDLSIALLGLYFLLVAGDDAWHAVRRHLPFSANGSDGLRRTFVEVTRATLLGTLLSAALQGLSIGIGLRIIGTSAPAFWGMIAGFTTLVPVVGNALVWIPAVIAPLVQQRVGAALMMVLLGKVVPSLIDRVVRAVVSRRVGNTHPMITLVGAMVGLRLLGPVGVLIGPTIVQCTLALIELYEREYDPAWVSGKTE